MLYVNFFADGGALLETAPQGDASQTVSVAPEAARMIEALLQSESVSSALAALFLAGVTAGERSVHRGVTT
jgi:hypothetical protein